MNRSIDRLPSKTISPKKSTGEITVCMQTLRQRVATATQSPETITELQSICDKICQLDKDPQKIPLLTAYQDYLWDLRYMDRESEFWDTAQALQDRSEECADWQRLFDHFPLVTVLAKHISDSGDQEDSYLDQSPLPEDFPALFERSCEALKSISLFFGQWQQELPKNHPFLKTTQAFLSAWQLDVERLVAEALNLGCCIAIKGVSQDELSYVGTVNSPFPEGTNAQDRTHHLYRRVQAKKEGSFMDPSLLSRSAKNSNSTVSIPIELTLSDIMDFLEDFQTSWQQILTDFQGDLYRPSTFSFNSGNSHIFLRPGGGGIKGQPRCCVLTGDPDEFSVRVDKESRNDLLSFEFCAIRPEEMLCFSEAHFLNTSPVTLSQCQKRALTASVLAQASQNMFPGKNVSHHMLEASVNEPSFFKDFDEIADCLCEALVDKMRR